MGSFAAMDAAAETVTAHQAQELNIGAVVPDGERHNSDLYDAGRLASNLVLGRLLYDENEPETMNQHAVGIVGTAISLTVAAPVIGTVMVLGQVRGTYVFVQEREQKALDDKLMLVSERVARIQREEVMRMRMEERNARAALPAPQREADQKRMLTLVHEGKQFGYSTELDARLEVEQAIDLVGQPPEDWYVEYKSQLAAEETMTARETGTRPQFMDGMSRMNAALDNQVLVTQDKPMVPSFSPR
ncbi:hypothetical protein ACEN2T_17940 [Pseudomonas sp. W22_MBD1_FP4]|uniref:hypothetical protein n=1 Tax=Pseudomonas sp. W22_MBD1_FP4 TaxID=3240272 RepID=UPI003F9A16E2